ncbi:hypothetical protein AURDEDRAFT_112318 [Auricularia subglabra TFB-10046 SS5]|nr:hypothetical protein AURDEDRAFT_112318 [Auricularia subglabra TFB-10046 SS5]
MLVPEISEPSLSLHRPLRSIQRELRVRLCHPDNDLRQARATASAAAREAQPAASPCVPARERRRRRAEEEQDGEDGEDCKRQRLRHTHERAVRHQQPVRECLVSTSSLEPALAAPGTLQCPSCASP